MKRIGAFIVLLLYLLSVEGILLHRHFCGGEIAEVSYFTHPDEKECCGTDDCKECYDDHITLRIQTEHVYKTHQGSAAPAIQEATPLAALAVFHSHEALLLTQTKRLPHNPEIYPPPNPLYLNYCSWLI